MKQIFYKSGMILAFFAATFFLCTFLISMLVNKSRADIIGQFSDDAKHIVIMQENNSVGALSYADVIKVLSECKARCAFGKCTVTNLPTYDAYRGEGEMNLIGFGRRELQLKHIRQNTFLTILGLYTIDHFM